MLLSFCSARLISATWTCLPCRMPHSSCWEPMTSAPFAHLTPKPLFSLQSEPSSRQTSDPLLASCPSIMNTGESLDTQLRSCSDQLALALSEKMLSSTALRTDLLFAVRCPQSCHGVSRVLPSDSLERTFLSLFSPMSSGRKMSRNEGRETGTVVCALKGRML